MVSLYNTFRSNLNSCSVSSVVLVGYVPIAAMRSYSFSHMASPPCSIGIRLWFALFVMALWFSVSARGFFSSSPLLGLGESGVVQVTGASQVAWYSYTPESGGCIDAYDTQSHFLNVDIRGDRLPTAKTSHSLSWFRDFGVGDEGQVTEVTHLQRSSPDSLMTFWTLSLTLGFTYRDSQAHVSRSDEQMDRGLNLPSKRNRSWPFTRGTGGTGGYRCVENDSYRTGYSSEDPSANSWTASARFASSDFSDAALDW